MRFQNNLLSETGLLVLMTIVSVLFDIYAIADDYNVSTTTMAARAKKARLVRKLKRDFRKLKKQEGAIKLVGGENGDYEGGYVSKD